MNRLEGNFHHPCLINLSNHWGGIGDYLRLADLKTMMRPEGKVDQSLRSSTRQSCRSISSRLMFPIPLRNYVEHW